MAPDTSQLLIQYGFPLFWYGVGIVQWFWPSALFLAFSNEDVSPGARGVGILCMVFGIGLGLAFIPLLYPFSGWAIPGVILLTVGFLQRLHPVWSSPLPGRITRNQFGGLLSLSGVLILAIDVV